jgi:hypothetical protein
VPLSKSAINTVGCKPSIDESFSRPHLLPLPFEGTFAGYLHVACIKKGVDPMHAESFDDFINRRCDFMSQDHPKLRKWEMLHCIIPCEMHVMINRNIFKQACYIAVSSDLMNSGARHDLWRQMMVDATTTRRWPFHESPEAISVTSTCSCTTWNSSAVAVITIDELSPALLFARFSAVFFDATQASGQ